MLIFSDFVVSTERTNEKRRIYLICHERVKSQALDNDVFISNRIR